MEGEEKNRQMPPGPVAAEGRARGIAVKSGSRLPVQAPVSGCSAVHSTCLGIIVVVVVHSHYGVLGSRCL